MEKTLVGGAEKTVEVAKLLKSLSVDCPVTNYEFFKAVNQDGKVFTSLSWLTLNTSTGNAMIKQSGAFPGTYSMYFKAYNSYNSFRAFDTQVVFQVVVGLLPCSVGLFSANPSF